MRQRLVVAAAMFVAFAAASGCATAASKSSWTDVERVVAVGDVHGDYAQFVRVLTDSQLIDDEGDWSGGKAHLVQIGDVLDRGPDSRKAMDLLMKLEKQARRRGGYVHALIGNHEAMNLIGDLRYVHPGEYAAFAGRKARSLQSDYYRTVVNYIKENTPEEEWPVFDEAYEEKFRERHPLGFVEHMKAFSTSGKYGRWIRKHNTVVRINDTLYVHGGLSGKYSELSLDQINEQIRRELASPELVTEASMIRDPNGPLWYRGLALNDDELAAEEQRVADMLAARDARRIVVAHTPLTGAVVPRFDARVIAVDVGLAAYYGGRVACLVIENGEMYALHRGVRIDLPAQDEQVESYLRKAAELDPQPSPILEYLEKLSEEAAAVPETVPEEN